MNKVLISAFRCDQKGVSEAYVGYRTVREVSNFAQVWLVTTVKDEPFPLPINFVPIGFNQYNLPGFIDRINGAIKFDYFLFDWISFKKCRSILDEVDLVHHITPQAPRYPSRLGRSAKKFIIGPVGGGLRVPPSFRSEIEKKEPLYFRLRRLDKLRLRFDPFLRGTYDAANIIIVTARYMFDILPVRYHHKMRIVLETGIDCPDNQEIKKNITNRNLTRILYAGRVVPYKGLEYLLRAIFLMPSSERNKIRLDVVGEYVGSYADYCMRLIYELDIEHIVKFYGKVAKDDMQSFYESADIFCFPTLAETTGNVILEAMSHCLPVISTNHGGPAEVLDDASGILVEPNSPEDFVNGLSKAIIRLSNDNCNRMQMGANARKRVSANFSWEAKGKLLKNIYDEVMDSPPEE